MLEKTVKMAPLLLIMAGMLLFGAHVFFNLGTWAKSTFLAATGRISHPATYRFATYDKLLHGFVKDGLVDYKDLKQSPLLNQAVDELERVSGDALATDQERLCFWINSYNLAMLKLICDHYPMTTVKQLGNVASRYKFIIGGDELAAQDIYLLRVYPFLKSTPKALFLVSAGAIGYPRLLNHALEPVRLAADEDYAAYQFVNDPDNVKYDDLSNSFLLSPLFVWNNDLFVPEYGSPHHFANLYLPPEHKVDVDRMTMLKTYLKGFDWRLNDTALAPQQASKPVQ